MKKFCDYCNKEYEFDTHIQWMSHRGNCEFSPNFNKKYEKLSKLYADKRKEYEFVCSCGKKYKLNLTEYQFDNEKYRKHCGISCANKRKHSAETRLKIAKSNPRKLEVVEYECLNCGKKFKSKRKNRKFHNTSCATSYRNKHKRLSRETKDKLSVSLKEQYKNGRQNYAGWTKWYDVDTNNGKIKVQGTYEVKAVEILEKWKLENKIKDWEYTKDTIDYIGEDGKKHIYLLDFKVFDNDNKFYYIETKGYKTKKDELKWAEMHKRKINLQIWYKKQLFNK